MNIVPNIDPMMGIKFYLDKPEGDKIIGSGFLVSGWIIEKSGKVSSVSIYVGSIHISTLTQFYERPDVQSVYPDYYDSLHSGFQKFVNNISEGDYELKIMAMVDGKQYPILSKMLKILPPYSLEQISQMMKNDWNKRAIDDAEKFVYNKGTLINDSEYDELSKTEPIVAIELLQTVFPEVLPANMKMLEIGCGIGRLSSGFSNLFRHYTGVDVSEEMVKIARKQICSPKVDFHVNNGVDLKMIKDRSEDFVFEAYVFQHIPNKNVVFNYCKETHRILKEGGYFMGLFWKNMLDEEVPLENDARNGIQVNVYTGESVAMTNDTIYGVQFDKSEIHDMLKKIGFVDIKFIPNRLGKSPFLHHLVVARKLN